MKNTLIALGITAIFANASVALADQATIDRIENASFTLETKTLQQLAQSDQPYNAALAAYRLSIAHSITDSYDKAEAALDDAIHALETLTQNQSEHAEAWALLSRVYATKINYAPLKGMYFGPKAGSAIAKAQQLAPSNPRVNMIAGINNYYTPATFGGSKASALKLLDKAIANYRNDSDSNYHWGEAEAYVWRGIINMEMNNSDLAKSDWQQALRIAPNYGWAQMLLSKQQ